MKKNRKLTARMRRTAATLNRLADIAEREARKLAKLKHPKAEDLNAEHQLRTAAFNSRTAALAVESPLQPELPI